jgi:hypothetical protein
MPRRRQSWAPTPAMRTYKIPDTDTGMEMLLLWTFGIALSTLMPKKKRTPNARRPCTCKVFPMMHKRKRTCADSDGGEPYVVIKHLDRVVQRRESRYALLSIDTNYRTLQPLRFFFLPPPVGNADGFPLDEVAVPTRRSSCSLCSSPTAIVTAMSKISSTPSCSLLLHSM